MPKPYNSGLLVDERGTARQATGGPGDRMFGQEVERQYNTNRRNKFWDVRQQDARRAGFAAPTPAGALRPAGWSGYSGIMRGLSNAADTQGMKFDIDIDSWGNAKDLDVPSGRTYVPAIGEVAPGMRGRPSAAIAGLTGADPTKRGYYTPDEYKLASGGLKRAFRGGY